MSKIDTTAIIANLTQRLSACSTVQELDKCRVDYLGKSGLISSLMKEIAVIEDHEAKKEYGSRVNAIRNSVVEIIDSYQAKVSELEIEKLILSEAIDITLPARSHYAYHNHPVTNAIYELRAIMERIGFEFIDGTALYGNFIDNRRCYLKYDGAKFSAPHIENDWYNFSALNIGVMHPARQLQDTFYCIVQGEEKLLRTHTSNIQIRYADQNKALPIKIVSCGPVFRVDSDATHTPMFHQMECIYLDHNVSMANLKWTLEYIISQFFGRHVPIRIRPSYFPFTEPSIEIDVLCDMSDKKNIQVGSGHDWLEVLGAGMIHNNVRNNMGITDKDVSGFAFGLGIERIAMLKYGISDLRTLYSCDVRRFGHHKIS